MPVVWGKLGLGGLLVFSQRAIVTVSSLPVNQGDPCNSRERVTHPGLRGDCQLQLKILSDHHCHMLY
jgi:hypothetical protein